MVNLLDKIKKYFGSKHNREETSLDKFYFSELFQFICEIFDFIEIKDENEFEKENTYDDIHAQDSKEIEKKSSTNNLYKAEKILNQINNSIGEFKIQTPTILHKTEDNFSFLIGDYNHNKCLDLYAIKKSSTDTNSTEVHVLSGKNNFQSWLMQTGTILHETEDNFNFCLGDYNNDGFLDLYAIKKSRTGTNSTEVHILSGKNNFQSWLMQTGTILHETEDNFNFCLGDYNNDGYLDLYAIKKSRTGTNSTEVHVLSGKNNFHSFLLQTGTKLHETDDNWEFGVSNYSGKGKNDLYCIKKNNTDTNSTEVHILDGSNNYQSWLLQTGTKLHETYENFCFVPYKNSLYSIKKNGINSTEVHILNV